MKNRITKKAAAVPTPRTKADMETLIGQMATLKRAEARMKHEMDAGIAAAKAPFTAALSELEREVDALTAAAEAWASSNPTEFGKNKSIKFLNGVVGFRTGQPTLTPLKKWTWAMITAAVERMLPNFIRSKPEVDKAAILGQRDELAEFLPLVGLRVTQDESFFVDVDSTPVQTREVKEVAV